MAERNSRSNPNRTESSSVETSSIRNGDFQQSLPDENATFGSYEVVFSIPWIVRGAESGQDAINIAVSEVGKRISSVGTQTKSVDINVQQIGCDNCGTSSEALLLVSRTALVGLLLEVKVNERHPEVAEKVARREIGPHLHNTPLTAVKVSPAG